jgi:hypothetical protein
VQHFLQIEGGPAYDLEHVGGGGLLVQRFVPFADDAREICLVSASG